MFVVDGKVIYPGWPYAAKAVIEHDYTFGTLNIWLTFPEAMNQLVKPDDTKWHMHIVDLLFDIDSSAWQDKYTLLLTDTGQEQPPGNLLISYDGPGPETWSPTDPARKTLETISGKQWEPFGPILSIDITT
jgi:hypothetical protein